MPDEKSGEIRQLRMRFAALQEKINHWRLGTEINWGNSYDHYRARGFSKLRAWLATAWYELYGERWYVKHGWKDR